MKTEKKLPVKPFSIYEGNQDLKPVKNKESFRNWVGVYTRAGGTRSDHYDMETLYEDENICVVIVNYRKEGVIAFHTHTNFKVFIWSKGAGVAISEKYPTQADQMEWKTNHLKCTILVNDEGIVLKGKNENMVAINPITFILEPIVFSEMNHLEKFKSFFPKDYSITTIPPNSFSRYRFVVEKDNSSVSIILNDTHEVPLWEIYGHKDEDSIKFCMFEITDMLEIIKSRIEG